MATETLAISSEAGTNERPQKRIRAEDSAKRKSISNRPQLYAPFRALGLVTTHVPFVLQTKSYKGAVNGPKVHILTCLGNSWALWDGGKMTLLFVGSQTPEPISSLAMDGKAVWAATGTVVRKYHRGKEVLTTSNPFEEPLTSLLVFGSQLLALSEDGGRLLIWNTHDGTFQSSIQFEPGFTAVSVLHPATYLNKILVAGSQGSMQLWNIRTQTCIHKYSASNILSGSAASTSNPIITCLVQSPAIDVVGIGFASGEISVYDIRADERLMRVFMQEGSIRSLAFRNDGTQVLSATTSTGHIAFWDLSSGGKLLHVIRGAHEGAATAIEWIPGQPILVSSGEDNSVKQWLSDSPTTAPRLHKFRSGHHEPPHLIRYYGEDGKQLLTASRDRSLRYTSVVRDSRSFELSQGSLMRKASTLSTPIASLKFPPIVAMSHSTGRAKDWDDIVTSHVDEGFARSWSLINKKHGKHSFKFDPDEKRKGPPTGSVKAVCVSACGNFCLASTSSGMISMWNMQSGLKRKKFEVGPRPPGVSSRFNFRAVSKKQTEYRSVTGLATDALNRLVIASTLDGTINFFDFHTTRLEDTLVLPSAATAILLHRDSGLLAVVCDDLVVRLVDIETRRIVRELKGFRGRILDVTFSPDSRWLVVASLDSIIRTFDIPTGRLVDAFRTPSVATSLSFSPTNDFLATSHVDSVGVFLWANRAQYAEVSFQTISENDIADIGLPTMQEDIDEDGPQWLDPSQQSGDMFASPDQLAGELATLTLLPRSRWQTLLNLEVIQQRNKPKEPPKPLEKAPFFLPTLPGVEHRFAVQAKVDEAEKEKKSAKRLKNTTTEAESTFLQKLRGESTSGSYDEFFNYAKTLTPAAMDLEVRSLVTIENLQSFMVALIQRLRSRRDFEAVQTYQNVFLRIHGEVLVANPELLDIMEKLLSVQKMESERVLELVTSSLGTLNFVREVL